MATGHLSDGDSVVENLEHGLIPLFHETQLHQHNDVLLRFERFG